MSAGVTEGGVSISTEANKALVRRYVGEWSNAGNEALLQEMVAPDCVVHASPSAVSAQAALARGIEGLKRLHEEVRAAWPDNRWTIEDILGEGDRVAVRMTNRATHQGPYRGIPATGREVVFSAMWIYRIAGGKIAEAWRCADDLGRVVQLGAVITVPS